MESDERSKQSHDINKSLQVHQTLETRNHNQIQIQIQILSPKTPTLPAQSNQKKERFLDFLRAHPSKEYWLQKFRLSGRLSPYAFIKRVGSFRGSASPSGGRCFRMPFVRKVGWRDLLAKCKSWAKHPMNMSLLVWLLFVAAGVAFLFLLMVGALNGAVPDAGRRKRWMEIDNQILNALFTVMCIYQQPQLFHHLVLLLRWREPDVAELRGVYCKNGAAGVVGPRERLHVAVVVILLHVTCFAQYGYCALFWLFSSETRPDWAVNLCMAVGLATPIAAGMYMIYGPLGRKIVLEETDATDEDDEAAVQDVVVDAAADMKQCEGASARVVVAKPAWAGGLFDVGDDLAAAGLSLSCTFCVFGWNMERLGFGNMYVHVFTFALLCAAPLVVFSVAALNIRDEVLRDLVGAFGAVLAFLGLLYGGFWRAQMRRRFGLPADRSWCGRPAAADYAKWLFCGPCALAQEVRTGNFYDVEEDGLYLRDGKEEAAAAAQPAMQPLEREGSVAPLAKAGEGALIAPILVRAQQE